MALQGNLSEFLKKYFQKILFLQQESILILFFSISENVILLYSVLTFRITMPQILLPIFPSQATFINSLVAFQCRDDTVIYFNGMMPIFNHHKDDIASFRMIVSQFYINGIAKQSEIVAAFGISPITLKRAVALYRKEGPSGFFKPRSKGGGPSVLKPDILSKIQKLLDDGEDISSIGKQFNIYTDTIRKAIADGRLKKKY